jgi:YD repeat-containing protein
MPRPHGAGTYTQTRTFVYDTQGRMTSETNPETGTTSYEYDYWTGRMWRKTDARGYKTEWSFDIYQRVTQERHYNASLQLLPCETYTYRYDSYEESTSQYAWGRLTETKWGDENPQACGAGEFREQYGYDQHGRQVSKTVRFKRNDPNHPETPNRGEAWLSAGWTWSHGRIASIYYPSWFEGGAGWNGGLAARV